MLNSTIAHFMTRSPVTVGADQKLSFAHRLMQMHHIRHLPVLDRGRLVGLLSDRDLHLVETLKDVDPDKVEVEDAMSPEVFTVGPRTSVKTVARTMVRHKYGSAIVVERGEVIGVFTTIDALRIVVQNAESPPRRQRRPARRVA